MTPSHSFSSHNTSDSTASKINPPGFLHLKSDCVLFAVLRDLFTGLFCVNINGHTGGMYRQCEVLEEHQSPKTWQETQDQRESEEQKLGSEPAASNKQN